MVHQGSPFSASPLFCRDSNFSGYFEFLLEIQQKLSNRNLLLSSPQFTKIHISSPELTSTIHSQFGVVFALAPKIHPTFYCTSMSAFCALPPVSLQHAGNDPMTSIVVMDVTVFRRESLTDASFEFEKKQLRNLEYC